jgi:hypothetical protein
MRQLRTLAALSAVTLLAATTAWAGGAACSAKSEASAAAKGCTVSGAKLTSAKGAGGSHCSGIDKNNAEAMAKACVVVTSSIDARTASVVSVPGLYTSPGGKLLAPFGKTAIADETLPEA